MSEFSPLPPEHDMRAEKHERRGAGLFRRIDEKFGITDQVYKTWHGLTKAEADVYRYWGDLSHSLDSIRQTEDAWIRHREAELHARLPADMDTLVYQRARLEAFCRRQADVIGVGRVAELPVLGRTAADLRGLGISCDTFIRSENDMDDQGTRIVLLPSGWFVRPLLPKRLGMPLTADELSRNPVHAGLFDATDNLVFSILYSRKPFPHDDYSKACIQ